MDAYSLSRELDLIKKRTNRLAFASIAVHMIAGFLFLALRDPVIPPDENDLVTEILWLEEVAVEVAAIAPPPVAIEPADEEEEEELIIPAAGSTSRLIQERISDLGRGRLEKKAIGASMLPTVEMLRPTAKGVQAGKAVRRKVDMARSGSAGPSLEKKGLERGSGEKIKALTASPIVREEQARPADSERDPNGLPGVSLTGPVSDRSLVARRLPDYPDWAKSDGVEASVQLYFTVRPNGKVMDNILIERTSGFEEFDENAKAAIADWRFESLPGGDSTRQWGRIVINYRLSGKGRM